MHHWILIVLLLITLQVMVRNTVNGRRQLQAGYFRSCRVVTVKAEEPCLTPKRGAATQLISSGRNQHRTTNQTVSRKGLRLCQGEHIARFLSRHCVCNVVTRLESTQNSRLAVRHRAFCLRRGIV